MLNNAIISSLEENMWFKNPKVKNNVTKRCTSFISVTIFNEDFRTLFSITMWKSGGKQFNVIFDYYVFESWFGSV